MFDKILNALQQLKKADGADGQSQAVSNLKSIISTIDLDAMQAMSVQHASTQAQLENLIEAIPGGAAIYRVVGATYELVYQTPGVGELTGRSEADYESLIRENAANSIYPDDIPRVMATIASTIKGDHIETQSYRVQHVDGHYVWISASYRRTGEDENGNPLLHVVFTPVSIQNQLYQKLADEAKSAIVVSDINTRELLYINQTAKTLLAQKDSLSDYMGKQCFSYLFGYDAPCAVCPLAHFSSDDSVDKRLVYSASRDKYFQVRAQVTEWYGRRAFVEYIDDITAETKSHQQRDAMAQSLKESEDVLEAAIEAAGIWVWRYDSKTKTATMNERIQQDFGLPLTITDMPSTKSKCAIINPAHVDIFYDAFNSIQDCNHQLKFVLQLKLDDTWHWARFNLTNIFDADGNVSVTACTTMLIDTEKQLEARYRLEKSRPSMGTDTLVSHALFNLTTGKTLEYHYNKEGQLATPAQMTYKGAVSTSAASIIDDTERLAFIKLHDTKTLLSRFAHGEVEFTLNHRRHDTDGTIYWAHNILKLMRDPQSSDILLFEYRYNIDDKRLENLMNQKLVAENYEDVVRIDLTTLTFHGFVEHPENPMAEYDSNMPNDSALSLSETVLPEDRDSLLYNISVDGIVANLNNNDHFSFVVRQNIDDRLHYKRFTYSYLDKERNIIVMTREDITDLIEVEAQKNQTLAAALEAANQASTAKSQFLSRMSHELRTPMNAIIGLSALAASDVDKPDAMADAIAKIGMSARYLLALINDILEMSRIESGRMNLNEGPFDFEALISSVNTIIYGQCRDKGVDYDAVVNGYTEGVYLGDVTKLQQILINVLGNAVKFTDAGGKITLTIEQLCREDDRANLRFTISDTGCGIDEAFIPDLFDAFSQESASYTSTSMGTGLGLAITKNMVEMMDGNIHVKSIKDVGSVFTIEVYLGISEDSRQHLDLISAMNLNQLRALVVDDDVLVCESTRKILSSMGMQAEWVENGRLAVEKVERGHTDNKDYDTIFIDWKMPGMDGIETTRRIRRIVGPDVTIIIMTAYDWHAIEDRARAAGVDLFMEKPLFQSTILNAFEQIFLRHKDKIDVRPRATTYDFTGVRVLLAEDHPLNVEVATRLLKKVHLQVDVARNGLEALESFTTAPDDFYDLILMDIRMPVMDGLTAASNIRKLKKTGSRDIPIVAMTANAFDEDVEQSLSHGMNAHIIKPIDPTILYGTIARLLEERRLKG